MNGGLSPVRSAGQTEPNQPGSLIALEAQQTLRNVQCSGEMQLTVLSLAGLSKAEAPKALATSRLAYAQCLHITTAPGGKKQNKPRFTSFENKA